MMSTRWKSSGLPGAWVMTVALACGAVACGANGSNGGSKEPGGSTGSGGSTSGSGGTSGGSGGTTNAGGSGGNGPIQTGDTPLSINGQLHVCGTHLCNQYDQPIQLRGMSTHGLQWFGWGDCVNEASLDALAEDWGADILRISLYVQEGGYETDPEGFTAQVDTIIEHVHARGMYALIDWHMLTPGDPWENVDAAKTYFTHMAQKHGGKGVLYEIANEPNGGVSWADIKSYAEEMIPVIREHDPGAVIIVGTRAWSSFGLSEDGTPSEVIDNPVDADNVMYTFHFYAASHGSYYTNAVFPAADEIPIFVTEWGTQDHTGDGDNDFVQSQAYIDWMAEKKISWTNWNFSDDHRSGAAFTTGTCPAGPFAGEENLKEAGKWVRERIRNPADDFPTQ